MAMLAERDGPWYEAAARILDQSATYTDAARLLGLTPGAAKILASRMRDDGWPIARKGKGGRPRRPQPGEHVG